MDKERQAFEAWVKKEYGSIPDRCRFDADDYESEEDRLLWHGWQARAKQTITLPVKDAIEDPCPGCRKGSVCRTPKCGRLNLPTNHPFHPLSQGYSVGGNVNPQPAYQKPQAPAAPPPISVKNSKGEH